MGREDGKGAPENASVTSRPAAVERDTGSYSDGDAIKRCLSVPDVLEHFAIQTGSGGVIRCPLPGHEDTNASFSIIDGGKAFCCHGCGRKGDVFALFSYLSGGDGKATRETFAECAKLAGVSATLPETRLEIAGKEPRTYPIPQMAAAALAQGMNRGAKEQKRPDGWHAVQEWTYCHADGTEAGRVLRFENGTVDPDSGKAAKYIRPLAKVAGGWRVGDPEGGFPLYRLPELLAATTETTVYVCEGEKAGDALADLGLVVTTCAHGAKSASKADWSPLAGRRVVVVPDNDEAGRGYAETVTGAVLALDPPGEVSQLHLPDLPERGDAVEYIAACRDKGMDDAAIRAEVEHLAEGALPAAELAPWPHLADIEEVEYPPLPPFPWDCLPPVLADHAKQVATCYQVPPEYPAMAALVVAGFAMGNRTFVQLKPGVLVRPNLYCMVFMASGERKSSAYRPMTHVLDRYGEDHAEEWEEIEQERRIHQARKEQIEKKLADPRIDGEAVQEMRRQLQELRWPEGTCKDFMAENATEEALQMKAAECGERVAVFSADARDVILVITGLYSSGQNRDSFYLKGFDGDQTRVLRKGRNIYLERPSVSVMLCVQNDKLKELGANAGLFDGGFMPRLMMLVPDSLVGSRFWREEGLDAGIQAAYEAAIYSRLDKHVDQQEDCLLGLSADAKAVWVEWYNDLEADMGRGEEFADMASFAVRWQALPVRLAAIVAEYSDHAQVEKGDMERGITLAYYLIQHGQRAVAIMGRGQGGGALARVVSHIVGKELHRFIPNDLRRAMRAKADDVQGWLADLEKKGYVRRTDETRGHKSAPVYEANPELWE